jgi:hypothetical protein
LTVRETQWKKRERDDYATERDSYLSMPFMQNQSQYIQEHHGRLEKKKENEKLSENKACDKNN